MLHELRFYVAHSAEALELLKEAIVKKPGVTVVGAISQIDYVTGVHLATEKLKAAKKLLKAYEKFTLAQDELEQFLTNKQ